MVDNAASPPPSQSIEARFGHLLNPIRDLTKNWEVDLAGQLQEYLAELEHLTIVFCNGETTLNFAEAALLVQGSTCVYSKKVEYLYSLVQQILMSMKDKKKAAESGAGKHCDIGHPDEQLRLLNDIKCSKNIDLKDNDSVQKKALVVKLHPKTPPSLIALDDSEKSDAVLYNIKGEELGSRDDFRINSCTLASSGILFLHSIGDLQLDNCHMLHLNSIHSRMEPEHNQNTAADSDDDCHGGGGEGDVDMSRYETPVKELTTMKEVPLPSRRRKSEIMDQQFTPRRSLRPRNIQEAFQVTQRLIDPYQDTANQKPLKKGKSRKVVKVTKKRKRLTENTNGIEVTEFCMKAVHCAGLKYPLIKLHRLPEYTTLLLTKLKKKKKLKLNAKEGNENLDDKAANSDDDDDDRLEAEGGSSESDGETEGQDNKNRTAFDELANSMHKPNGEVPVVSSYDELLKAQLDTYFANAAQYVEVTELTKRVNEWESKIKPILEQEEQMEPFDIRAYGTRILDKFSRPKQCLPFEKLVRGKDEREVCRYFLASLQLANHYNVKISSTKRQKGGSLSEEVNTMALEVLSRKRHHDDIEEFQV